MLYPFAFGLNPILLTGVFDIFGTGHWVVWFSFGAYRGGKLTPGTQSSFLFLECFLFIMEPCINVCSQFALSE